jgi:glycolate oxidase subunit GlcD
VNDSAERDLAALLGGDAVLPGDTPGYSSDETEGRDLRGRADAIVRPRTTEEVARAVRWCCDHDVPVVPRGGGTGFAGGAVPVLGGVVIALERMARVRALDPGLWRMQVEAGLTTAHVRRLARESGLLFPPDPGAAEQSQIGGNVATNAGGPHAFKYGVTGSWVTGIEAVVPPGEAIAVGGPIRKDAAGYDLRSLLVGSEGTLGVITAVWLRLIPAPAVALPVVAFYPTPAAGTQAVRSVMETGLSVAALEFLDAGTLAAAGPSYPGGVPAGAAFAVLADADGDRLAAEQLRTDAAAALGAGALRVDTPDPGPPSAALWRWRDGVSVAVTSKRGGKASEDIVVPVERLAEAIDETLAIGARHALEACSWGHAGDGNLHGTFLLEPGDAAQLGRSERAAEELYELAVRLGGSVSGEHGMGWIKRGQLERQWAARALDLHDAVKHAWDPTGVMNPGKKAARRQQDF